MKTREDFNSFYKNTCKRTVEQFEKDWNSRAERYSYRKYRRNLKWMGVLCVIIFVLVFAKVIPPLSGSFISITFLYAIIAPIVLWQGRRKALVPRLNSYKKNIIQMIISFIDPNLTYHAEEGISKSEFNSGGLQSEPDRYKSYDLVYGKFGRNDLKMSFIKCTSGEEFLMEGLYAISNGPHQFPSKIIIYTTTLVDQLTLGGARKLFGSKATETFIRAIGLDLVTTGHDEFDKIFSVACSNPEAVKPVVTPELAQLLVTISKESDCLISLAFFNSQVHMEFNHAFLFTDYSPEHASDPSKYFDLVSWVIQLSSIVQGQIGRVK